MTNILVVEDDPQLSRALQINLHAHGYKVAVAPDGATALEISARTLPAVVVLDLGLPDMDGTEVIRRLRGWSQVPIIVLSARHDSADKVDALDAGADDYVTKPFGLDELLARLRAAGRRAAGPPGEPLIPTSDFDVDLAARRVTRQGEAIRLTPTEWSILALLARNAGRLVSQQEILLEVWGPAYAGETQYLRVYINQLRRKLEPDPGNPRHILTEAGRGYRFEVAGA